MSINAARAAARKGSGVSRDSEPKLNAPPRQPQVAQAGGPAGPTVRKADDSISNRLNAWVSGFVAVTIVGILVAGWLHHEASGLTPGNGLGYWLGIVGGLTMLAVLGYPIRKYVRAWRSFGTTSGWFSAHMLLGTIGPAIVLFHAGFQLGATNSNVALISMLCVAGSGIVGRFLYGQIHQNLHGRRTELSEMTSHAAEMRLALGGDLPQGAPVWNDLTQLEAMAQVRASGIIRAVRQSVALTWRASRLRRRAARDTRRFINDESKNFRLDSKRRRAWHRAAREHLDSYFASISSAAKLILFERLFAAWHLLHGPLFVVMALSVVVHIVAVHFY
jgi:hypothetical protein